MLLALRTLRCAGSTYPPLPVANESKPTLKITVVFTSIESTRAALQQAGYLAHCLGACITLLVAYPIPYAVPLTCPPVALAFHERRLRQLASESPLETTVYLYLCRDRLETLKKVLTPGSLLVVGCRKTWWSTGERSLARKLQKMGHEVVRAETE
jgi:hypothetical protein